MPTWVNKDGLMVRYGVDQGKRGDRTSVTNAYTKVNELTAEFTLTGAARTLYTADLNNDGTLDGFNGLDTAIPAGAKILSADFILTEAPAGGTNWAAGTYQEAGTVDDADGLLTVLSAAGAQVGTTLSAARYVTLVTTGTYTAGKVRLVVRYLIP